jgi:hypothetical protein
MNSRTMQSRLSPAVLGPMTGAIPLDCASTVGENDVDLGTGGATPCTRCGGACTAGVVVGVVEQVPNCPAWLMQSSVDAEAVLGDSATPATATSRKKLARRPRDQRFNELGVDTPGSRSRFEDGGGSRRGQALLPPLCPMKDPYPHKWVVVPQSSCRRVAKTPPSVLAPIVTPGPRGREGAAWPRGHPGSFRPVRRTG